MTDPRWQRGLAWAAGAALTVVLAVAGYRLLFTTFMLYDDEGYVLISLQNFSRHGGLYDQVYTQYGPFPFLWYDALHRLGGFAFTNTSGRWITLLNWVGTAGVCAALVARATRSATLAGLTLAATFIYLWVMIREPVHPGSLITLLVAVATWASAEAWAAQRIRRFAAIAGIAGAILLLTKINVGLFFLTAAAAWLALNHARAATARTLTWLIALGCAGLPFVLMHALLAAQWVRIFALVFSAASLAVLLTTPTVAQRMVRWRDGLMFLGGVAGTVAVLAGLTVVRGTSWRGLVEGVLLEPIKHPGVYSFAMYWQPGTAWVAVASLVVAAIAAHTRAWEQPRVRLGIAGCRLLVITVLLLVPLHLWQQSLAVWGLSYGISLVWLFVVPLQPASPRPGVRAWIALVLIFQALHAYPVAGSQLNWGTFLWVPLLVLGGHDALPVLGSLLPRLGRWPARVGAAAVALITLQATREVTRVAGYRYAAGPRLGLPGAENVRVANDVTYPLRIITENLRAHAAQLFSLPGVYSTNLWTGLPTPTLANATHWFSLLSARQQQEIIDRLAGDPRAVVLVQRVLLDHLTRTGFPPHGPLYAWLKEHFVTALSFGGYEIWVPRNRTIAGLSLARARREPGGGLVSLDATLPGLKAPVSRIELCAVDKPEVPLLTFAVADLTLKRAPCRLDGSLVDALASVTLPLAPGGLCQLQLRFRPIRVGPSVDWLLLVLRDPSGAVVGELLLVE